MSSRHGLVVALVIIATVPYSMEVSVGESFNTLLTNLANDALGVQKMQDYIDNIVVDKKVKLAGNGLIIEISQNLADKFKTAKDAVHRIKEHYERSYSTLRNNAVYYDCCNPPDNIPFRYDVRLKGKVNADSLCYVGVGAKQKSTAHLDHTFVDVMKDNLNKHDKKNIIKWQFIGTEEGIQHVYPAPSNCKVVNSNTYDPRFRPWYVQTVTPKPKDVVIVIDHSLSMNEKKDGRTLMRIALEAAKTVVETLNPNDKVGVIAFSDNAETPAAPGVPGCYKDTLAQATPVNKKNIKKMIEKIHSAGGTKYIAALQKAFQLLSTSINSTGSNERDASILFLSDGRPNEDAADILSTIRDNNSRLGNKVIILTFGIGDAHKDDKGIQLLKDMAEQKGANSSYGETRKGRFTSVPNPNNLRKAMGTYYEFFSEANEDTVISVPYFDTFGLGLITSVCSPLRTNSSLRGIACVDISLAQLLGAAAYFRPSERSYAFIVDRHGRLMTHPLLQELYDYNDEPLFVDMLEIERETGAKEIQKSMLSGGRGEKKFRSKRIISRGNSINNGVDSWGEVSGYFWTRIEHTNYSVCIVIGMDPQDVGIQFIDYEPMKSFLYHRLDLVTPPGACNNFGQLAVIESAIKFATRAFVSPSVYFDTQENRSIVLKYGDMMLRNAPFDATFREGVKETVAVTKKADDIWLLPEVLNTTSRYSIWKYIGTQNGVHRTFPAHPLYTQYDPTQRPWYKKAMSNKGRNTLSPPYQDAGGAGIILTLSKTIFQKGSRPHASSDPVLGVMGLDFSISRFYTFVVENSPECMRNDTICFVMDSSGYLVFHRDFVISNGNGKTRLKNVHIIEKEPGIAYDLIDRGIMRKEACVQFSTIRNQYFWRVETGSSSNPLKFVKGQLVYELHDVPGSNVFFGKKLSDNLPSGDKCKCVPKKPPGEKFINCNSASKTGCECPCSSQSSYEYCDNVFRPNGDGWPACVPDPAPVTNTQTLGNDIAANLSACFDFKCDKITSLRECRNVVGCIWCSHDSLGRVISQDAFCTVYGNCPRGIEEKKSYDGQWGTWSEWEISTCSAKCGNGTANGKRSRQCDSPPSVHRGRPCTGDDVMESDDLPCVGSSCSPEQPGNIIAIAAGVSSAVVLAVIIIIVGVVCWRRRQRPLSSRQKATTAKPDTHAHPFNPAYPGSLDQSSSTEQSSSSSTSGSALIHSHIPFHISHAQPHNPVYESGDGEIGQHAFDDFPTESNLVISPQVPARPFGGLPSPRRAGSESGIYISPGSPVPVSQ